MSKTQKIQNIYGKSVGAVPEAVIAEVGREKCSLNRARTPTGCPLALSSTTPTTISTRSLANSTRCGLSKNRAAAS
ncbi:hypothetical protein XMV201_003112 [Aliiroseovarius sp. xm-v-201]|nr:hypothetical protein [Aliiroseovarius sp. xm-m-314]NRP45808.1 hypothetical protein [Aliiroseovarius sp. xm-m-378]NRP51328.1 hypothetical protein [Aliiroseovarius sp. xm-m-354]NRP66676.1 hypothetical protein [Aliiroseovarius sp. xm-v-225]NRP81470.1 hypothetical protein [Aliiroseovarius sp. xm-v-209]NRP93702.1 hypothetical protein [Aliiroseovarius sp. xm-a-134]NRQ06078.1 hypothetical protein [Aliiroseovarius sp. xm-m-309]NRQ09282.1 hypothetical protein [Aliiroseovarius sp. xm-v-201]NRQ1263